MQHFAFLWVSDAQISGSSFWIKVRLRSSIRQRHCWWTISQYFTQWLAARDCLPTRDMAFRGVLVVGTLNLLPILDSTFTSYSCFLCITSGTIIDYFVVAPTSVPTTCSWWSCAGCMSSRRVVIILRCSFVKVEALSRRVLQLDGEASDHVDWWKGVVSLMASWFFFCLFYAVYSWWSFWRFIFQHDATLIGWIMFAVRAV